MGRVDQGKHGDVDRESAEYAVEDLLKVIRIVGRTPGVERVHLIAHSRGTDTLATALAQLSDVAIAKIFKVFSAPDLPFGEKAEPGALLPSAPGLRVTLYVSPDDKAIATASWLLGSIARLGRIDAAMLTPEQITAIGMLRAVDIIQVRGTTDFFGHSYFVSNPRVSADIVTMLGYDLQPNEPGRPWSRSRGLSGACRRNDGVHATGRRE